MFDRMNHSNINFGLDLISKGLDRNSKTLTWFKFQETKFDWLPHQNQLIMTELEYDIEME